MPGSRSVIVSPHLDDAVLSCWHLLTGPGEVLVVNVFAGVPENGTGWWDRETAASDSAERMRERFAEDRAALAVAGRTAVNLDLLDDQYRHAENGDPGVTEVAEALRQHLAGARALYAPVAWGAHPDHRLAREAALRLRAEVPELWLYADLPHLLAGAGGERSEADLEARARSEPHPLDDDAFERKLAALRMYRTQISALEKRAPLARLREERLWRA